MSNIEYHSRLVMSNGSVGCVGVAKEGRQEAARQSTDWFRGWTLGGHCLFWLESGCVAREGVGLCGVFYVACTSRKLGLADGLALCS